MSSIIKHSLIAAVAAIAMVPAVASAEVKVGVVNTAKLLEESPQAQVAQQALETEFLPRQRELADQQKALQEKEEKLKRDTAVMAEADRGQGRARAARRPARPGAALQRTAGRRQPAAQRGVRQAAALAAAGSAELRARQRLDLIVSDGVLFAAQSVDITAQVVAALKAKAPLIPGARRATGALP